MVIVIEEFHVAGIDGDAVGVGLLRVAVRIVEEVQHFRIGQPAGDVPGRVAQHIGHVQVHVAIQQVLDARHLAVENCHVDGGSSADVRLVQIGTGLVQ